MISYRLKPPGEPGIITTIVRLWWTLISHYHTYRWLLPQMILAHRRFVLSRSEKRSGETAVVTGGSKGIGAALVKTLLQSDMHVIIGCRHTTLANNLVKDIRRKGITSGTVETLPLDLTSLNSIREFCYRISKRNYIVTILVNNAGVTDIPYGVTVEGFEHHFQVNYLGPFFLTYLLLPKLHDSSEDMKKCSRIVNVTSVTHYGGYPDLNDPQMKRFYSSEKSHMDSKLMLIAYSNYLNKQLQIAGASVRSYAVHPGFVKTSAWEQISWVKRIGIFHYILFRTADQAAESIAYAALSPELEDNGGVFISNNDILEPHSLSIDKKFQRRLWEISHQYLHLQDNLCPSDAPEKIETTPQICSKTEYDYEIGNGSASFKDGGEAKFYWEITTTKHSKLEEIPSFSKPYYEYFISNLFTNLNLNKKWFFSYLEVFSIFLLHSLDKFNSQFKLFKVFE